MAKTTSKMTATKTSPIEEGNPDQVIYADHVLNFGVSSSVCRITLGVEVNPGQHQASAVIIMPTEAFLIALDAMTHHIKDNKLLKENMKLKLEEAIKQIESF